MIKVFLVEDEIVIREAIQRIIPWTEYGFEFAGEAKDGEVALPLIRKVKPDVLITDIKMPFMDGLTLSKLVKKELPDTHIVIVSGYDDFEYARQAISLGVEHYLLKPITKSAFQEVLENLRKKYEKENEQKSYYEKFQNEIKEYEKNARRDFFELLVSDNQNIKKLYEKAEKLHIDIMSQCYNLILFTVGSNKMNEMVGDTYSQNTADIQEVIDTVFQASDEYLLFRNQMFSYAILVRGDNTQIGRLTEEGVNLLKDIFEKQKEQIEWFVCTGEPVERLSQLSSCYKTAMKSFAFRYMGYSHVFSYEQFQKESRQNAEQMNLVNVDMNLVNPDIFRNFLCNALEDEIEEFVKNYFQFVGEEALQSKMFRQYILLNIHFCTIAFIQKLGYEKSEMEDNLIQICSDNIDSVANMKNQIVAVLKKGISLREESSKGRYQSVIQMAVNFMQQNYTYDELCLNRVACAVNISANHFSALFSQEMKQTFIEYLTGLRMQKAKELLRCTDKRSGEIALEVGYKDSHYFSFLFKKTQGCTPSEYRHQGGKLIEKIAK